MIIMTVSISVHSITRTYMLHYHNNQSCHHLMQLFFRVMSTDTWIVLYIKGTLHKHTVHKPSMKFEWWAHYQHLIMYGRLTLRWWPQNKRPTKRSGGPGHRMVHHFNPW